MAKDAYYFSHDSNARYDPDICDMRTAYGSEGYGWYWMLVEMLREQTDYKLKLCKCNAYAMQMQCERNAVEKFIDDCTNQFNLFQTDGENFWSDSLLRRMKHKEEKSEKARQAATSRWGSERNADAMRTQCERNAIKESKVKENKVKESKVFSPDSDESRLANLLFEKILLNNPSAKEPNLQTWAKDMDLLLRVDKRSTEDVEQVIVWCQTDSFWKANILSVDKLRKKYDQLKVKMLSENENPAPRKQQGQAVPLQQPKVPGEDKFAMLNWGKFGEGGN